MDSENCIPYKDLLYDEWTEYAKSFLDPQLKSSKDKVFTLIKQRMSMEDTMFSILESSANSRELCFELLMKFYTLRDERRMLKKLLEEATDKYNAVKLELCAAKSSMEKDKKSKKVVMAAKSDKEKQLAQISAQRDELKIELKELKRTLSRSINNQLDVVEVAKLERKMAIKLGSKLKKLRKKQVRLDYNLQRQGLHLEEEAHILKVIEIEKKLLKSGALEKSEKFRSKLQEKRSTLEHVYELTKLVEKATDNYDAVAVQLELYTAEMPIKQRKMVIKKFFKMLKKQLRLSYNLKRELEHFEEAVMFSEISSKLARL